MAPILKNVRDWMLEACGTCTPRRKVHGIVRLSPSSAITESVARFKNGRRVILCLDGGGVRGIITLQALKALEATYGRWEVVAPTPSSNETQANVLSHLHSENELPEKGTPDEVYSIDGNRYVWVNAKCIDMFDMFAGTSTGAIIAGALAWGVSVDDLIRIYREKHKVIFTRSKIRLLGAAIGMFIGYLAGNGLGLVGGMIGVGIGAVAGYFFTVPWYDNKGLICLLRSIFHEDTLAHCHRDLLITAKDTVRGETTYFTSFHPTLRPKNEGNMEEWLKTVRGRYKDVSLTSAIAASAASAPLYFKAIGRFIDGGLGSFNNLSYAAPVEAIRFSADEVEAACGRFNDSGDNDENGNWPTYEYPEESQLYRPGAVKVVSLGTGKEITHMRVGEAGKINTAAGWALWIVNELMDDASEQQSYIAQCELDEQQDSIDFQRFQLYWSKKTRAELQDIISNASNKLEVSDLPKKLNEKDLRLDAVRHFDVLDTIGQAYGKWLSLPRPNETIPRFEVEGGVTLGDPVRSNPARFHMDEYSKEVKDELA